MLASTDGVVSHNTDPSTAGTDISEPWNRTARLDAGTGTYLGEAYAGTRWVLTANHVSSLSGTITDTSTATPYLVETFSRSGASVQCTNQDSGSGMFVKNGAVWELTGVAVTVGFIEDADDTNPTIFATYFINLAPYAEQIHAIMTIPEPNAFSLFAGTFALGLCTAGQRRRASAPRRL